jgi:hypothetical protein
MNLGTSPTGANGQSQRSAFTEIEQRLDNAEAVAQQQGQRIVALETAAAQQGEGAWSTDEGKERGRQGRSATFSLGTNSTFIYFSSDTAYPAFDVLVTATSAGRTLTLQKTYRIHNVGTFDFTVVAGSDTRIVTPDESVLCHFVNGVLRLTRG